MPARQFASGTMGIAGMAQSAALARTSLVEATPRTMGAAAGSFRISTSHRLGEVEAVWRRLTARSVESPGQIFEFVRLWIDSLGIAASDQYFILAEDGGTPVALLPLQRRWDRGVRVLSWFPGAHVGCNAPLVDASRLAAMPPVRRAALWRQMLASVRGADLVYLKSVPQLVVDGVDLFAELGESMSADTLYRASFTSFEEADRTQRNKSRRKHDRQQGDKLEAMGEVRFEEMRNGVAASLVLDTMFQQRAARFREMGVFDPFCSANVRAFYDATAVSGSHVPVMLHVLTLNGDVVAVRYNIVYGDRIFCLISSMSEDISLRPGSPGKQCLLRVMQTVFDAGYRAFDMGEGLTDEKRHWCNVQVPVRHHYVPVTRRGTLAALGHRGLHQLKARVKSDPRLLELAKRARGLLLNLSGRGGATAPTSTPDAD
jgi:CelD/BcsL family acetyltransferase involved in cellulose biosynthesis